MDLALSSSISKSQVNQLSRPAQIGARHVRMPAQNFNRTSMPRSPRRLNPLCRSQPTFFVPKVKDAPISPDDALERLGDDLTPYEKREIVDFEEIWFVGSIQKKNPIPSFDTMLRYYRIVPQDHIAYRYEVQHTVSTDELGTNIACHDHKTNRDVVLRAVINTDDGARWAEEAAGRLQADLPGVVKVEHAFRFRNHWFFDLGCVSDDLNEYAKKMHFWEGLNARVTFPQMGKDALRKIAREILVGLASLHREGLVHGGLTPQRVLECGGELKVFGFGYDFRQQPLIYRAPEIVMRLHVDSAADIWSFGCILVELINNKPLFNGRSEREMFSCYTDVLGKIPKALLLQSPRRHELLAADETDKREPTMRIEKPGHVVGGTKIRVMATDSRRFEESLLLDFIDSCLEWWPSKRTTAEDALRHPWLSATESDDKLWKKMANTLPNLSLRV